MKIETKLLKSALDNIRPIVGRRTTLPILSCVKLHTERNRLHITASNLDEYQIERLEADEEMEPCCVNYHQLCAAIGGEFSDLKFSKGVLTVKIGIGKSEIKTLDAEEYPPLPKDELSKFSINCEELAEAVNATSWAASADLTRYMLQSVHIQAGVKMLRVESTDSRNLALFEIPLISSPFEAVIPSSFAANFSSALLRSEAELSVGKNWVRISHEWGNYFCKQMDGKYPNTKAITDSVSKNLGVANVSELKEIFDRCDQFSDKSKTQFAAVSFLKTGIKAEFIGVGAGLDYSTSGEFQPHECQLNASGFRNCLRAIKSETVKIKATMGTPETIIMESGNLFIHTSVVKVQSQK